eukprot:TRINITY_DN1041_c0_g1_i1.p1 TRINITY_DN1041_c0_g1~~TRINITY_DN1041_c0_g1_i1.p1  ORF type:complete len:219 (-),score=70.54 TRINITY_DN1041_c0_g1_i1:153-788(-)
MADVLGTVPLPPGLAVGSPEWEDKARQLLDFARQLFGAGEAGDAPADAATGSGPCLTLRVEPSAGGRNPSRRYYNPEDAAPEYPKMFAVTIGPSKIHGRGMFALQDFDESEIVEVSPTLEVHHSCVGGILEDYVYYGDKKDNRVLVMGYGMMYNSWKKPNLWYYRDSDANFVFVASRPIRKGEELCIDYGEEWWESRETKDMLEPEDGMQH